MNNQKFCQNKNFRIILNIIFRKNQIEMNSETIFSKDTDNGIYVMKIFEAEVSQLWDYFTKSELIDLWWAPRPWRCETQKMEFRENGIWLYAMVGPAGEKVFSSAVFDEIMQHRSFGYTARFSDDEGNINHNLPKTSWLIGFTGVEEGTKMTFNLHFGSAEEREQLIKMGFEGGFRMGLNQLEDLLKR